MRTRLRLARFSTMFKFVMFEKKFETAQCRATLPQSFSFVQVPFELSFQSRRPPHRTATLSFRATWCLAHRLAGRQVANVCILPSRSCTPTTVVCTIVLAALTTISNTNHSLSQHSGRRQVFFHCGNASSAGVFVFKLISQNSSLLVLHCQ